MKFTQISRENYRAQRSHGGSKKGRRILSWRASHEGCICIVMAQKTMENRGAGTSIAVERDFGGEVLIQTEVLPKIEAVKKLLDWAISVCEKHDMDANDFAYRLYQRAHKGFYDGWGPQTAESRARIGKEHYLNDPRLRPFQEEAERYLLYGRTNRIAKSRRVK